MATRRKPVQARGEARRQAVLAAAWEVFREMGYARASMDEITRRAGGSKVSVYAHFGSKEAIFEAVVRWRAGAVAASYTAADAPAGDGDVEGVLKALAGAVMTGMTSADVRDLHRVALSAAPGNAGVGRLLYEHGTLRVVRAVADVIATRMKAGELTEDDPMAAAEALFGLLLGTDYIRFALGVPERPTKSVKAARVTRAVRIFLAAYRSGVLRDPTGNPS